MNISTVMLVDDDAHIRRVAEITLAAIGKWKVIVAPGGAEALELLTQQKPDLVLLDVMMPVMDGPTTLTHIRQLHPELPVIFMTAKVQQQEVETYLKSKANGVISKPFDPMLLPSQIQEVLSRQETSLCATA